MTNVTIPANISAEAAKRIQEIILKDTRHVPEPGDVYQYLPNNGSLFNKDYYVVARAGVDYYLWNLTNPGYWTTPHKDINGIFSGDESNFKFIGLSKDVLKVT